jgi:MFS transporter, DHA2 family, multidrug resistance protein
VTGIAQILSVVIAARLSQRIDPRWMITAGLSLFASSLWFTSYLTPEWGFAAFALPQMLRGFAIMLCIVPSVTLALSGFAKAELRYASGLFNLIRNLGAVRRRIGDGAVLPAGTDRRTLIASNRESMKSWLAIF